MARNQQREHRESNSASEEASDTSERSGGTDPPQSADQDHSPARSDTATESDESRADQSRFLVGLEYDERAERRRVEYRLENWNGTVSKVPRMTRILEGEDFYELYDELQETVDNPEHLSVYELDDITPSTEERTVRIKRAFDVELDRLEWATQSLLDKRPVTQINETTYEVRPEASDVPVTLEYQLTDVQQGALLELTLTGPTPAPNAVKDAMLRDLGYLLPEPVEVFDE